MSFSLATAYGQPLQVFDLLNARKRLNILEDGKKQVCKPVMCAGCSTCHVY
jgi:hypothetical protein